jgi:hypothetical protein
MSSAWHSVRVKELSLQKKLANWRRLSHPSISLTRSAGADGEQIVSIVLSGVFVQVFEFFKITNVLK